MRLSARRRSRVSGFVLRDATVDADPDSETVVFPLFDTDDRLSGLLMFGTRFAIGGVSALTFKL